MMTGPTEATGGVAADFLQAIDIAADHPAFAGHFPGKPIVPGVVLLDLALLAIGRWFAETNPGTPPPRCEIANAKFLSPLTPGESLQLRATRQPGAGVDTIRFALSTESRPVASGVFKLHQPPSS